MKTRTNIIALFFLAALLAGQAHAGEPSGPVAIAALPF